MKTSDALTLRQRLQLRIRGYVFLRREKKEGWKAHLPIYLARCPRHGLFEQHPHGWYEDFPDFPCPKCLGELKALVAKGILG